jgi:hypothetical protein
MALRPTLGVPRTARRLRWNAFIMLVDSKPIASAPSLGTALGAEHVRIRLALADMASRAASGDFRLCDDSWDALAADLERHLCFEEAALFPRFGASSDEAGDEVARLSSEHHVLRRRAFELGVGLQTRSVRPDDVSAFLADLERHAAREDTMLYPWATATFGASRPVCELEPLGHVQE